jgi:hypothetical protein
MGRGESATGFPLVIAENVNAGADSDALTGNRQLFAQSDGWRGHLGQGKPLAALPSVIARSPDEIGAAKQSRHALRCAIYLHPHA